MHAHMGMKLEEWEDGKVNIGIAVCPTKPPAIAAIASCKESEKRNDKPTSKGAGDLIVVPKSAFIIRPPEYYQSQGKVSVAYAHKQSGREPSKFIVTFRPQDQGHQDKIRAQQQNFLNYQGSFLTENMKQIEETKTGKGNQSSGSVVSEETTKVEKTSEERESGESKSLKTPQDAEAEETGIDNSLHAVKGENGATGFLKEDKPKRTSDMKRVSWVDDAEILEYNQGSYGSIKEYKESARKSNGVGNNNYKSSPSKKQHGFSSADNISNGGGVTGGSKRNGGDKSRIPAIVGDYPSCEFYRRQMLRECMCNPPTVADNWYGYGYGTSIQKYAGEKVRKRRST